MSLTSDIEQSPASAVLGEQTPATPLSPAEDFVNAAFGDPLTAFPARLDTVVGSAKLTSAPAEASHEILASASSSTTSGASESPMQGFTAETGEIEHSFPSLFSHTYQRLAGWGLDQLGSGLDSGPISFPLFNETGLSQLDQQLHTPKSVSGPDSFSFDSPLGVARENTSKVTEFPKEGWPRSLALSAGMGPPQPAQQPQIAPASVYATNDCSQVQPAAAPGQQIMSQQAMDSQYGAYYQSMMQPASDPLQYQQIQMQQQQQPMQQAYSTPDQSVAGDVPSKRPRLYEDSTPSAYAQVPAQIPAQQVFMPSPHSQAAVQISQQVPPQPQPMVVDQPRARPQYSDDDEAYEMDELDDDEEADSVDSGSKRDKKRKSPSKSSPQSNEPIPDPMMDDGEDSESDFDEADENVKQLERLNPERVLVMQRELGASIGQSLMELMSGPAKHQCADFIVINLLCGRKMRRRESLIFLTAVSAKRVAEENSSDVVVHNLKISKDMIQGRTKGFKFYLLYTLISGGERVCTLRSKSFYLWSNINQQGFPRQQRDKYLADKKLIIKGRRKR